jgi:hypothetical protein
MFDDMEQDLILACKMHYGENGVEKVISDYVRYKKPEEVELDSKYHFISNLYVKLVKDGHLNISCLLNDRLSPRRIFDHNNRTLYNNKAYGIYEFPKILCDHMVGEIQGVKVRDGDNILIELHEAKQKYKTT